MTLSLAGYSGMMLAFGERNGQLVLVVMASSAVS
jgi:hypothetical protein